jgi:dienelactone hydrolase
MNESGNAILPVCMNHSTRLWRLFLPQTAFGVLSFAVRSPWANNSQVDLHQVLHNWIVAFIGLIVIAVITRNWPTANQIFILSFLSPYTLGVIHESRYVATALTAFCYNCVRFRRKADQSALDILYERILSKRAIRFNKFDLYLPPFPRSSQGYLTSSRHHACESSSIPGFIFLPGAYVDHTAYAPIAAKLSDKGIVVAVLSMEPIRLAAPFLGGDPIDVIQAMKRASKVVRATSSSPHIQWNIGGHSAGAYAALRLARQVHVEKCCIWAAGNLDGMVPDLSMLPLDVLTILASNDKFAFLTDQMKSRFLSKMPKNTSIKTIIGGNHAGFGAYPSNEIFDGTNDIGQGKQHELVCSITASFLFYGKNS